MGGDFPCGGISEIIGRVTLARILTLCFFSLKRPIGYIMFFQNALFTLHEKKNTHTHILKLYSPKWSIIFFLARFSATKYYEMNLQGLKGQGPTELAIVSRSSCSLAIYTDPERGRDQPCEQGLMVGAVHANKCTTPSSLLISKPLSSFFSDWKSTMLFVFQNSPQTNPVSRCLAT